MNGYQCFAVDLLELVLIFDDTFQKCKQAFIT